MVIKGKISLFTAVGRVVLGAGRDQVQLQGRVRPGPLAQQTQISRQGEPSLESPFNIITVHSTYLFLKQKWNCSFSAGLILFSV
jgi:hypothetical protein